MNAKCICEDCRYTIGPSERVVVFRQPGCDPRFPAYMYFHEQDGRRCYTNYLSKNAYIHASWVNSQAVAKS